MSRTVDERVVEMRFDNKQFESATKETLGTLAKLKEALKLPSLSKSVENLNKVGKTSALDGLISSVEALERRFSTLGIVGMRVIENIADGLMNKLTQAVHFATDAMISGGIRRAMNIENAHFQLQALLKDEAKVQEVMDDAMTSVDGTAYAFDEAAKAAAQFAASGIQAGEDMLGSLKGITGVAAMTNSSFEDISRIFTTVAGNGRLMGDQLLQLSSRGLNAASTLADYFREVQGEASITEADIRELVTKGQISFKMFADAMNWAFGESAERANETFTGALANMKSALARIGAGFVSPLIEQNSELVKLFNTLRIQINNVKSALVFDEQKSAISGLTQESNLLNESVSELLKNGTKDFDTFTTAILETSLSEKDLEKANLALSESYNQVRESGSASVDTLIEFNKHGIDASKALRDYMNGVMDGSIKASESIKQSVNDITGGVKVISGDITKFAEEGKISYEVFTDAIVHSSGLVQNGTALAGEAVTNMMKKVEEQGYVTVDTLIEFNQNGINAANALKKYMNGVTDGSIRASYATTQAINEITQGAQLASGSITELAEQGVISYDILQSALEEAYGNQKTLSKQFTDSVLDMVKRIRIAIDNIDLTKPLEAFYYGVETIKNLGKGLYSVLKPIAEVFDEVFLDFSMDGVLNIASKIEMLTSKFRANEKQTENLRKTFKGLFSIVKLLVDIFIALVRVIIPVNEPIAAMGDGLLGVTASLGETLTGFTEWVRKSPAIAKAYELVSGGVQKAMTFIADLVRNLGDFIDKVKEIPAVKKIIDMVTEAFNNLGDAFGPLFNDIGTEFKNFFQNIQDSIPDNAEEWLNGFLGDIERFANSIDQEAMLNFLTEFTNKIKAFIDLVRSNEGFDIFLDHMVEFFKGLQEAFTIDTLLGKLDYVREKLGEFIDWIKQTFAPVFENFSLGGILAAGGGGGLIYVMMQAIKTLDKWGAAPKKIAETFAALKGVFIAWQKDIQANTLLKIAGAIAILAGALTLLSFADTERLMIAAGVLGSLGFALMSGIYLLTKATNKAPTLQQQLTTLANALTKGFNQLAKGVKWKLIGAAVKDMAESIAIIAAAIVGIGLMSQKNPAALEAGIMLTVSIAAGIGIMVYAMSKIGEQMSVGMTSFGKASGGVLALCLAVGVMVLAIKELMEIELPATKEELELKMGIFASAILGVGTLVVALGQASKLSEGNKMKSGPILAAAAAIVIVVKALEMLLELNITLDDIGKITIFGGLFVGLGYLINTLGKASKQAGGALKGAATLLALAGVIVILVGALAILSFIPFEKMLTGAVGLGIVLVALGVTLKGAGKITTGENFKSIAAMALIIGALVAALGLLSMIPLPQLAKSVAALGIVLLAIAAAFAGMGQVKTDMFGTTLAMIGMVGVVALSLYALSNQPWDSLLAAGGAMALVIASFALVYLAIGKAGQETDMQGVGLFLLTTVSVLPIAAALYTLSTQPWEGILAAGLALSSVIAAYGLVFKMISETDPNLTAIGLFIFGTTAVIGVAVALRILTDQPWEGLLASGAALSLVLVAMAEAMAIVAKVGQGPASAAIKGIGLLDLFVADLIAVLAILGGLWSFDWFQNLITGGLDALITIGYGLGDFVGSIISGFGAGLTSGLKDIGKNLSDFMGDEGAGPFFEKVGNLDPGVTQGVKDLASMLLTLTAAELLQGLMSWISGSTKNPLVQFGEQLKEFGPLLKEFADSVEGVNASQVQGAAGAAQIMSEMANTLPSTGGLYQKIFGEKKSLTDFAKELSVFGPAITVFALSVQDVKPSQVEGAASAGKIMSEMADTLPNTGGLYQQIFGEKKTLSEFAVELMVFGPSLVGFAKTVEGITPNHVSGAAAAGQVMAKMANELPSTESLWNKIFGGGTVSLTDFAAMLVEYGNAISDFATSVEGIDPAQIDGVVESTKKIADLAKYLEEVDPYSLPAFASTLSAIGEDCVDSFITAFKDSDMKVIAAITILLTTVTNTMEMGKEKLISTGIETAEALYSGMERGIIEKKAIVVPRVQELGAEMTSALKMVLSPEQFETLGASVIMALIQGINSQNGNAVQTVDKLSNAMLNCYRKVLNVTALSKIGTDVVSWIILGIDNQKPMLMTNVDSMANTVLQRIRNIWNANVYINIGQNIVQNIIRGINNIRPNLMNVSSSLAQEVVLKFQNGLPYYTFYRIGQNIVNGITNGIYSDRHVAVTAVQNVCSTVLNIMRNGLRYTDFYDAGRNVSIGLANGIASRVQEIAQSAAAAARAAIDAVKGAFDIQSPSKVMARLGRFVSEGLAVGIQQDSFKAVQASQTMSNSILAKVKDTLAKVNESISEPDLTRDLTLNPVINANELRKSAEITKNAFNDALNLQIKNLEPAQAMMRNRMDENTLQKFNEMKKFEQLDSILKSFSNSDMGTKVNNQFYIQGDNAQEIADEVSRILSNQLERKQKTWG